MKKVISAVLVISMIFSLCSCTIGGSDTKLTMGILDEITTLDPLSAKGNGERIISSNCIEGLLRFDAEGNIDLAGATGYTADKNALSYTFKLNPSAKWYLSDSVKTTLDSTGVTDFQEKITAEDYIYGIKRFIESGRTELNAIKGASKYNPEDKNSVLGLKAVDDYTLQITLEKVDPDFLYKLAVLPVYPCDEVFCTALDGIYYSTPATTLCNGPYYIKEVTETETIIERNPDYNGNIQIANKSILLYSTGKKDALAARFKDGSYDIFTAPDTEINEDIKPSYTSVTGTWGFVFNCKSEMGKINELRDILLSSVDYSKIKLPDFATEKAENIIHGNYTVFDEKYSSLNTQTLTYKTDTENAQKNIDALLKKLDKETISVKFVIPVQMKNALKDVISSWQKLFGDKIIIDLRTFDITETDKISTDGDYDMAILPLLPETRTALGVIESVSGAPCYFTDKRITVLTSQPKSDAKTNATNYSKAEKLIVESGVFVPLFFASNDLYMNEGVSGVYTADGGELIYFHGGVKEE